MDRLSGDSEVNDAVDFVVRGTLKSPSSRMTVNEALKHPAVFGDQFREPVYGVSTNYYRFGLN